MIRNAHRLTPKDGRRWKEYRRRVIENPERERALTMLDSGHINIPKELKLEGATHADCLLECTEAIIWIEGKRNDWLAPNIDWDITRDQLARNLDAALRYGQTLGKDFWLLICHEYDLKHHEQALVDGYRLGTWTAGFPHLPPDTRARFKQKIGTVRWQRIFQHWPALFAPVESATSVST